MDVIYFDNSATTRISDAALTKYNEISRECYGNPSSLHALGFEAEKVLTAARNELLLSLGARDAEVCFTASGSEANNLAIIGRALSKERFFRSGKILITDGEHASVGEPKERLATLGFKVAVIPTVGGELDREALEREMTSDVILVSMMMVNNETGAMYDLAAVSRLMKKKSPEAYFHVDATQSYMKIPFTKSSVGADLITVSSHKIEGPKGVGALVIDKRVIKEKGLSPLILGGGQEGGLRSGTENVPGIAAFGEAIRIGRAEFSERYKKTVELRDYLISRIGGEESGIDIVKPKRHAPHIINLIMPSIKSETMLHYLSSVGIYVSSGSACSSNSKHTSTALTAFGISKEKSDYSIRVSLSYKNTKEEIDRFIEAVRSGTERLARVK